MTTDFRATWLLDMQERFQSLKDLGDRAIAQITDGEFFHQLDGESNSIAVLLQHMGGNLRSRWTDFLTTDGEKPDRNRDGEFVIAPGTRRSDVVARWEEGWRCVFDAFSALRPEDVEKTVRVRSEPHLVAQAIHRQVTHAAYHVGQIVYLAKHYRSSEWKTLTIPRGETEAFNRALAAKYEQSSRA